MPLMQYSMAQAVSAGELPRDSGLGMIEILFNLQPTQAIKIMGAAGTDAFEPATEEAPPGPAPVNPPEIDPAPPTKAAAGEGVERPPSVRSGS